MTTDLEWMTGKKRDAYEQYILGVIDIDECRTRFRLIEETATTVTE